MGCWGDDGDDESSDGSDDGGGMGDGSDDDGDGGDGEEVNRCEMTLSGDAASGIATETWTIGCLGGTCSPNDAVFGTYSEFGVMPSSVVACFHSDLGPGMRPTRIVSFAAIFQGQRLEDLVPFTVTSDELMSAGMALYDPDDVAWSMSWDCDVDAGAMTLSVTRAEPVDNGNIVTDYLIDGEMHAVCPADLSSDGAAGTITIDAVF